MAKVLICMADAGQDPTETAVPYHIFKAEGYEVHFATENGVVPAADPRMLEKGLFGKIWGAKPAAADKYTEMTRSSEFQHPLTWSAADFDPLRYDAILLPGGHDKPMRQYLESPSLHAVLASYFPLTARAQSAPKKVVGAICHGALALAFSKNAEGKSLLDGVESTTLPRWMEGVAWVGSQLWALGGYYRTYGPEGRWCADDLPTASAKYIRGPLNQTPFVHVDPNYRYISARWPGDAELFATTMIKEIQNAAI